MTFSEFQRSGTLRKTLVEPTSHSESMAHPTGEDHCCAPSPHTAPSSLAVWSKHLIIVSGMPPVSKQALSTIHDIVRI